METIYKIDWSQVSESVIRGLNDGSMRLSSSNGNAYWAAGSGHTGIVDQLPFIPTDVDSTHSLLQSSQMIHAAQSAQMVAIGLSTGLILGAIVVQTMYLAKKIDALQKTMDDVSLDVHTQNIVFYMNKVSDYFGAVEATRIFLQDRNLAGEVESIAPTLLSDLAVRRNQLTLFIDNILSLAASGDLTQRHYELILDFVTLTLELLPKSILVERELYHFVGKYNLGDMIGSQAGNRHESLISSYRGWCNQQVRLAIGGNPLALSVKSRDLKLKSLFGSDENKVLLNYVTGSPDAISHKKAI